MFRAAIVLGLLFAVAGRADLVCPVPAHDAGTVKGGVRLGHVFELHNTGDLPIEVLGVKTGCGCLVARPDRMTFAPGEKGVLRLEVNTVTQPAGRNVWGADVRYREAGREAVVGVRLTANLDAQVQVRPANLVLHTNATLKHPFTLIERRPVPMEVRSARTTSPHVRAETGRPVQQAGAWVRTIDLHVLPTCPEGRHECVLHLDTADPTYPDLRAPFTVVKKSADGVQPSPSAVELIAVGTQPLPARLVLLLAGDDRPVTIESVTASHPAIRATWASGPRAVLRVTVDRAQVPASGIEGSVAVRVTSPATQDVRVPVSVRVR